MSNLCNYLLIRVNLEPIKSEMGATGAIKCQLGANLGPININCAETIF